MLSKSLKDSLLELYDRAGLHVDSSVLRDFIRERDRIIHGNWDASRDDAMQTYGWAEYDLSLRFNPAGSKGCGRLSVGA
jgi:hypothetical protein